MKLKELFDIYRARYFAMRGEFGSLTGPDLDDRNRTRDLWNMAFAGLGAGTLLLRLGAIVQTAWYLQEVMEENPDPYFNKVLVERLRDKPVADGDWREIWHHAADQVPEGSPVLVRELASIKSEIINRFVNARNIVVHMTASLKEWQTALDQIDAAVAASAVFDGAEITGDNGETAIAADGTSIRLSPLVSRTDSGSPLIFQGVQEGQMKHIDGTTGDETAISLEDVADFFARIEKNASDRYMNRFEDLVAGYTGLFVGRERETGEVISLLAGGKRAIQVTSAAGMGKSAFMAHLYSTCRDSLGKKGITVETLVHFCGPGRASHPVAVLQNLLYQGVGQWNELDEKIRVTKKTSLPADFNDLKKRFHRICGAWSERWKGKKLLAVFVDGLDESSKVHRDPRIDRLFIVEEEDDKGNTIEREWEIPENVTIIVGHRSGTAYRLPENTPEVKLTALEAGAIDQVPWPGELSPATRSRLAEKGEPFGMKGSGRVDPAFLRLFYDMTVEGTASTENPASVPEGLTGLYDRELATLGHGQEKRLLTVLAVTAAAAEPVPGGLVEMVYARFTGEEGDGIAEEALASRPAWFSVSPGGDVSLYHDRLRSWALLRWSNTDLRKIHGAYADVMGEILDEYRKSRASA